MKHLSLPLVGLALLGIAACTPVPPSDELTDNEPIDNGNVMENVSYQGTVEEANISIYMEGTHRLALPDGQFILLSDNGTTVDLDEYLGMEVEVHGSSRNTVEGDATIVEVSEVIMLEAAAASSDMMSSVASSVIASSVAPVASSKAAVASPRPAASSVAKSSVPPVVVASSVAAVLASSPHSMTPEDDRMARAAVMAKVKMDAANWTHLYCAPQFAFCFPIHKSWYYKSFGTTSTVLWHVEISNAEIETLNQGPIAVNLVSGSVAAAGGTDGQVLDKGDYVVGYRTWNNNHFEVIAPTILEAAVRYITQELKDAPASSSAASSAPAASSNSSL